MNPNIPPAGYQQQQYYQQTQTPWTGQGNPMLMFFGNNQGAMWLMGLLWIVTWILFAAVLLALFRWLWKKGDKAGR